MTTRVEASIGRTQGVECPECEALFTPVRSTGHDEDGRLIRVRVCRNCGQAFGTVEISLPPDFSFGKTNTYFETARKSRVAYYSKDRIFIGTVKIIPGKQTKWCAKGLHQLTGKNLILDSRQHRLCRSCRNARTRQRRFENRDAVNAKKRENYRKRKERLSDNSRQTELGSGAFAQSGQ